MSRHPVARFGIICAVGLLALAGKEGRAQSGTLRGVVVDSAGRPIADAEVQIFSLKRVTRTDSLGRLTFLGLAAGDIDISFRRMGFHAQSNRVTLSGGPSDSILVTLLHQPTELDPVGISAIGQHPFFAGFDQRRRQGIGIFFTKEMIEARHWSTPSDIFRQSPEVRLVRTSAGLGIRFPTSMTSIRNGTSMCQPMIWLDGQRAPGLEIDELRSSDIQAIEMYRGPSVTPPQFASGGVIPCGAVVVWTRRKG